MLDDLSAFKWKNVDNENDKVWWFTSPRNDFFEKQWELHHDHAADALRYFVMDFGFTGKKLPWWRRLWNRFISFLHSFFMGHDTPKNTEGQRPSGLGCDPCNAKEDRAAGDSPYTKPPERTYNFSDALHMLKDGMAVSRKGWNGKSMYLRVQRTDYTSKMTLPYIYIVTPSRTHISGLDRCPWIASQTDLMSEDWVIVSPE